MHVHVLTSHKNFGALGSWHLGDAWSELEQHAIEEARKRGQILVREMQSSVVTCYCQLVKVPVVSSSFNVHINSGLNCLL